VAALWACQPMTMLTIEGTEDERGAAPWAEVEAPFEPTRDTTT